MNTPKELSKDAREILQHALQCDGLEVHKDDWTITDELVNAGRGHYTGPARGPGNEWKRFIPVT